MHNTSFFIKNKNSLSYIILFFIALFMLGTNPFKGETLAPMDLLVKYPGWQNTGLKVDYIHGERSDVLDAKLPIWISAKNSLYRGELPLWNHQRAGKPGLIFTNSILTPAFLTFALIPDDALGFYLSNLVNVLIGLFGMFFFLRLFFNPYASIFGATVFMFSGFNVAWFFWAHVDTAVWTPWVMYAVYKYIDTLDKKHLITVTCTMLMLNLGGFPMVAVMTYIATGIMVLVFFIPKKYSLTSWLKILILLLLFSLLSILIAMPFLYPLVTLMEWMGGIGYRSIGPGFTELDIQLFYNPNLYINPTVEKTFYVGILPLIFLSFTFLYTLFKPSKFSIFSLFLFILSVSLSFKFINEDIIKQIPIINSSMITRFSYLIDLSLALISAFSIQLITSKIKNSYILFLIFTVLFSVQIFQLKVLFNNFNRAVPNESFYPNTKSISYLQKTLKPLEHIISDRNFLIAGTLGGYGLNDWFSHSFHNVNEKIILNKIVLNPFLTPTAAMFDFNQINLTSPYLDYLGIKSIITTHDPRYDTIKFIHTAHKLTPSPTLPYHVLVQPFILNSVYNDIVGMQIPMGTYGKKHAYSDIQCVLKINNQVVEKITVPKIQITDNKWVNFIFESPRTLLKGNYTLTLRYTSKQTIDVPALVIWSGVEENIHHKLLVDGKAQNISFQMRFLTNREESKLYTIHNLEPNIYIWERHSVSENAYYLQDLNTSNKANYSLMKTTHFSNNKIVFQYNGENNGWVVIPMRYYPGWHAFINNKEVPIASFLGMMPAIKVDGKSKILLKYSPPNAKFTYSLLIISLLLLLCLGIYYFYKRESEY